MDRPGCHANARCVVSVYLASLADAAPLPRCDGVSTRAVRASLRMMCRIAQNDGTMRYGLRASKLAILCEYSVATIQRARRRLIELGYIERVRIGGGRVSTQWRIVVNKFAPADAESPEPAEAPGRVNASEKPQRRRPHWSRPSLPRPSSPAVTKICDEHGGDGGTLSDGSPRCPQCRRRRVPP